jgi:hypothetical protein
MWARNHETWFNESAASNNASQMTAINVFLTKLAARDVAWCGLGGR